MRGLKVDKDASERNVMDVFNSLQRVIRFEWNWTNCSTGGTGVCMNNHY